MQWSQSRKERRGAQRIKIHFIKNVRILVIIIKIVLRIGFAHLCVLCDFALKIYTNPARTKSASGSAGRDMKFS